MFCRKKLIEVFLQKKKMVAKDLKKAFNTSAITFKQSTFFINKIRLNVQIIFFIETETLSDSRGEFL